LIPGTYPAIFFAGGGEAVVKAHLKSEMCCAAYDTI